MPRKLESFELNMGWAVDLMSSMEFSPEEMKRVTFLTPFEDRVNLVMRGGIKYHTGMEQNYEYYFAVEMKEWIDASINILALQYKGCLHHLEKELPRMRQVEAATKRLMSEPKLKNEIWESPLTLTSTWITYRYDLKSGKISGPMQYEK